MLSAPYRFPVIYMAMALLSRILLSRLTLGAALLLAACSSQSDPPPPPPTLDGPITLSGTSLWAGQTLTLASADFAQTDPDDSVMVLVGDSAIRATRVDSTHYSISVPADRSGMFTVRVRWRGLEQVAQPITLYGFDRIEPSTHGLWWDQLVVPGNEPSVIGINYDVASVVVLNVVTGAADQAFLPMLFDFCRGAGPTPEPGVFLLQRNQDRSAERWRLVPSVQLLDTLSGVYCGRQLMQMSENVVFRSAHHTYEVLVRSGAGAPFSPTPVASARGEETEGVALSPRGDRATIKIDSDLNGIPVFDAATGLIAWRATSLRSAMGAEFSPTGNELLLVGADSAHSLAPFGSDWPGQRVELRDATNGAVVAARSFDRALMGATFDPTVDLVYVILAEVREPSLSNAPTILVLNGSTLATIAHLRLPATAPPCQFGCYRAVAAVSAEPAIYVVTTTADSRTARWRFTLPPIR